MKLNDCIALASLHWYFPAELRFPLNLYLEEAWPKEHKLAKELMLSSKINCLGYLILQDQFNENDFFGNIVSSRLNYTIWKLKFYYSRTSVEKPTDKRYSGWCRGPKDKGSKSDWINPESNIKATREIKELIEEEIKFELEFQHYLSRINILVESESA